MSYASVYEQTHSRHWDSIVTTYFRTVNAAPPLPVVRAYVGMWLSKYSTHSPRRLPVLRVSAMFEGLTEFCFVFPFDFRATLLDFTSRIEWLYFCWNANTVAHAHRQRVYCSFHDAACDHDHRPISCARSAVAVAAPAIGLFVARVTHYRQAVCSELWPVNSRHNARDIGHEIREIYVCGKFMRLFPIA